ncbi:hypothetical protein IEQ34_010920 [Dendrobium chrysotoxum]|uniref:Uncharacterized protein n=1 Tax=Dendrobium chrysotoxum TaxID=161865 RepID=A0AAV7GUU9_DENCH|nr:hypothetical protein IEQ34_010920 [Dendrobium chrysotoxum]
MVDTSGESSLPPLPSISIAGVPVTIIVNEGLKARLNINDACVSQTDWIDDSFTSHDGGVGDELDGHEENFNDMFNLNENLLVEKSLSQGWKISLMQVPACPLMALACLATLVGISLLDFGGL